MRNLHPFTKSILQLAGIALGLYFLFVIRTVLVYVAIALVLTLILKPVANKLSLLKIKKWAVSRGLAAAVTLVAFMGLAVGITSFVLPFVMRDMNFFTRINYYKVFDALEDYLESATAQLNNWGLQLDFESLYIKENLLEIINIELMSGAVELLVSGLGNVAVMLFSVMFILFFLLKQQGLGKNLAVLFTQNEKQYEKANNILEPIKNTLTRYFLGLMLQVSLIALIVFAGLSIIGIKNAVLIAVFAGLINLIPYVGPMIGFAFGITLGLGQAFALEMDESLLMLAGKISVVFAIVQLTDNFVLQPLIYSKSIRAHPLEIFLVISIAALLGGVGAMIVAIPVYSVLRIFIWEFFPEFPLIKHLKGNDAAA